MLISGNPLHNLPPWRWVYTVLLCALISACGARPQPETAPKSGAKPVAALSTPVNLKLTTLTGESVRLSEYRGKVIVLSYFTTWCVPCAELISSLDRLLSSLGTGEHVKMIGVNVDLRPKKALPKFIESWRVSMPILLADEAALKGVTPFGPLRAVPATYIIGRDGLLVETLVGTVPQAYLKRRLESLGVIE